MTTLRQLASVTIALPTVAALAACGGDTGGDQGMMPDTSTVTVAADAGLQTPESVLHDRMADVYLVSNINGAPTEEDGNGFISRVAPDGTIEALRWIDGMADGVTLNAPKGLALKGDTLFVTDITTVRAFHRETGEPLGNRPIAGSTFLNDLAVGDDGTLYVSDSGLNPDFSSSGTDAVYRFTDGDAVAVARGTDLRGPNGLDTSGDDVVIVSFGAAEARTVAGMAIDGDATVIAAFPGGQLDGVVLLDDGSMLVSSWETSSVYLLPSMGGQAMAVVENVPSPADIGWDAERSRVLIPVFQENRLEFHYVAMAGG